MLSAVLVIVSHILKNKDNLEDNYYIPVHPPFLLHKATSQAGSMWEGGQRVTWKIKDTSQAETKFCIIYRVTKIVI